MEGEALRSGPLMVTYARCHEEDAAVAGYEAWGRCMEAVRSKRAMTINLEELDQAELRRFREFGSKLFKSSGEINPPPETLWHYTSATGLLGIIDSGTLFATQVSCLNDTSEYQYLADLMRQEAEERATRQSDPWRKELYSRTVQLLGERQVASANAFVICLSASRDDLGQWRGYGGDACSFAIELDVRRLMEGLALRGGNTMPMRVRYDEEEHREALTMLLDSWEESMRSIWGKAEEEVDGWLKSFGLGYAQLASLMHAMVKHRSFHSEKEYRIYTELQHKEHEKLKFTAKRTLLARHIPVAFGKNKKLPVRSVMVGPGGAQEASRVSVGDLLKAHQYGDDVPIELSKVPYRVL